MSTDVDWQHELNSSFGTGPDLPAGHYVAAGHRAVRRRRRVAAIAVAATVAICGGAAWAASPGPTPRGDAPVATHGPSPTQATEKPDEKRDEGGRDVAPSMSVAEEFLGNPALLEDGRLKLSPLAGEVLQRVPNPMGYTPDQGRSTAIRVMYQGREKYSLIVSFGPGEWSINTNDATGDFASWVAANVRTQQTLDAANGVTSSAGDASDQWLVLDADGAIATARPGIVIVEQRTSADLGEGFSAGASSAGVVRLLVDGRSELAAYRVVDGTLDVIPAPGSFDSMSAFITWARGQYASGEGMR